MTNFPDKISRFGNEILLRPGRSNMRRGKIILRLNGNGFALSYGKGVDMNAVEKFLESEKVVSLLKKAGAANDGIMRGGKSVRFLGGTYPYRVSEAVKECRFADGVLLIPPREGHPDGESGGELPGEYADEVRKLIVKNLKKVIAERLPVLIEKTGLKPEKVKITSASGYWGNMHTKTHVMRISAKLAEKSSDCIDYVLLHELIHIRVPNHGAAFHAEMARYMPDYRQRKLQLKK